MNYYECIQAVIDHIEYHLEEDIDIDDLCRVSMMSRSNLYRMFFAMTGYQVKAYIKKRKICEASKMMRYTTILESALKYGFKNHETFTRAFKKISGVTPKQYKRNELILKFERMNIMDQYFEVQDPDLIEKYPDIKVLKKLDPFHVASYCYFGQEPETGAFKVISKWAKKHQIDLNKSRIFGFNNPSPMKDGEPYGYEVWVSVDEAMTIEESEVIKKIVPGGLYAVTSVKGGPEGIFPTWQRLNKWLMESKYVTGDHQWLEEHLGFDDNEHVGHIDIYMPIEETSKLTVDFHDEEDKLVLVNKKVGKHCYDALEELRLFKEKNQLEGRLFAYYDQRLIGKKEFWYEACLTINQEIEAPFEKKTIKGGRYAVQNTAYAFNGNKWYEFMGWLETNGEYRFDGSLTFFEEYFLDGKLDMNTKVKQFMPITKMI